MTGPGRFEPRDLAGPDGASPEDGTQLVGTARILEHAARQGDISPSPDFADAVMAAIADEPAPRPWTALTGALRRGSAGAVVASIGDAWRVAWGTGRPVVVRAQALAIVAVVTLLLASTAAIGAVGVSRLIGPMPSPSVAPAPTMSVPSASDAVPSQQAPVPTPAPTPPPTDAPAASSDIPSPDGSTAPSTEPKPSETAVPAPSDPGQGGGTARPTATPRPTVAARPTTTPHPTPAPSRSATPSPTPTEGASPTPEPTPTSSPPAPTPQPRPTPTPTPTPTSTPNPTPDPTPTPSPTPHDH